MSAATLWEHLTACSAYFAGSRPARCGRGPPGERGDDIIQVLRRASAAVLHELLSQRRGSLGGHAVGPCPRLASSTSMRMPEMMLQNRSVHTPSPVCF